MMRKSSDRKSKNQCSAGNEIGRNCADISINRDRFDDQEKISRKSILNQAGEDRATVEEEMWINVDSLYQDHIDEILRKWEQIDDEIWGKIIYMERNRRIAKAYARVPVLCVNGAKEGFDGYKIGLNGFESVVNDQMVKRVKRHIGQGVRIKIDETGNIIVKRLSNCDVFVRGWTRDANSVSKQIIDLSGELEFEKSVKLFDMKKFQTNVNKELRSAYPDRRKLESQCICAVAFVKDAGNVLDLPVWCLIVNIVALDMLKSKLPPSMFNRAQQAVKPGKLPRIQSEILTSPTGVKSVDDDKETCAGGWQPVLPCTEYRNDLIRDKDPYYYGIKARVCNNNTSSGNALSPIPDQRRHQPTPLTSGYLNKVFEISVRNSPADIFA